MPYVFPYEDYFVVGVALVILGLVLVRVIVARTRNRTDRHGDRPDS